MSIEATFEIASWDETRSRAATSTPSSPRPSSNAAGTGKFRADPAGSLTLDLDGVDTAIAEGSRR
jgi:hypothetical protein